MFNKRLAIEDAFNDCYVSSYFQNVTNKKEINEAAERHSFIAFMNVLVNFIINHALYF